MHEMSHFNQSLIRLFHILDGHTSSMQWGLRELKLDIRRNNDIRMRDSWNKSLDFDENYIYDAVVSAGHIGRIILRELGELE